MTGIANILSLQEKRDVSSSFRSVERVHAESGVEREHSGKLAVLYFLPPC